jgi:hypothetical protein
MSGLPESAVDDRYLPGHLGALTAYMPPELVEAVLAETVKFPPMSGQLDTGTYGSRRKQSR